VLPGKKYRPEDYLEVAWRRRWTIAFPFLLVALGTFVWSLTLKPRYQAEALILVVPQRVPERFVESTVTATIEDRIQTISQQILSRTRLERLIEEFNLYPEERRTAIMQDVVDRMRSKDIIVDIPREKRRSRRDASGTSFRVGFRSSEPRRAMQVAERLASFFIEESIRDREVMAEGTDQFLESQLEEARRQLLENEKRLEDYKLRHASQLPQQLQTNLSMLQQAEARLQQTIDSQAQERDRLIALDRLISEAAFQAASPAPVSATGKADAAPATRSAADQLEAARAQLVQLELRLRPEHPDIIRARRTIEELEKKAAAEALQVPLSGDGAPAPARPLSQAEASRRSRLTQLEADRLAVVGRLQAKQEEERRLRAQIAELRNRVEATPVRESELVAITRDYETLKRRYESLLSKREDARIAANLERRQIGEQFRLIDPPRLPERPVTPNLMQINLVGAALGLALGLALAGLLEYRDTSLRSDDDVLSTLALPVLALIPRMETSMERRRSRRRRLLRSVAAAGLVAVGAAAAAWRFLGLFSNWF
jgi:polysaccharide chain length determinant protein (PEP-CTERM system associated)